MLLLIGILEFVSLIGIPVTLIGFLIQLARKKQSKKVWGITLICFLAVFVVCVFATPDSAKTDDKADKTEVTISKEDTKDKDSKDSSDEEIKIDGTEIEGDVEEISEEDASDSFVKKLVSFGFTEDEAKEQATILLTCGVPSIDNCEATDTNASIDNLIVFRDKIDEDRVFWFTVDHRKIFYVSLNGEDLYDEDKGGYLQDFSDVHIPEKSMTEEEKQELIDLSETVLDKYIGDIRYQDAWGVAREDSNYMVRCQVSDGSILTDNWIFAYVWYEKQDDGSFKTTAVKIGTKLYEVK